MHVSAWIAKQIILASQYSPLRGRGSYAVASAGGPDAASRFLQAETEAARVGDFFDFFPDRTLERLMRGADILDFGSGYGGRTVEYAARYGARSAVGIEPFENLIESGTQFARHRGIDNVQFRTCSQAEVPLADESVDLVVSYDVLEHVQDPIQSMKEIHRVLRPGGSVFLVFPVYFGAFSHHLDYISLVPGLHWMFSADTLVRAVNDLLRAGGKSRFGTNIQPKPQTSFDGERLVLPNLNGLSGEHITRLLAGMDVEAVRRHGWIRRRLPASATMNFLSSAPIPLRVLDAITSSMSCIARKPAATASGVS